MFTVVYHFRAKSGLESEFQGYWHEVTELIQIERQSLGSRLHKSADGSYVAYAQWPSHDAWKNPRSSSDSLKGLIVKMNECLSKSEVTFELEVIDDLLVK